MLCADDAPEKPSDLSGVPSAQVLCIKEGEVFPIRQMM